MKQYVRSSESGIPEDRRESVRRQLPVLVELMKCLNNAYDIMDLKLNDTTFNDIGGSDFAEELDIAVRVLESEIRQIREMD